MAVVVAVLALSLVVGIYRGQPRRPLQRADDKDVHPLRVVM